MRRSASLDDLGSAVASGCLLGSDDSHGGPGRIRSFGSRAEVYLGPLFFWEQHRSLGWPRSIKPL